MGRLTKYSFIRSLAWRLGRKLYCWARLENEFNPEANGEYWLLEQAIVSDSVRNPVILDIGSHLGNWTKHATSLLERNSTSGHIYAFEPASSTFEYLSTELKGNENVSLHRIALSDQTGELNIYIVNTKLSGINSLCKIEGAITENVTVQRLDDFLAVKQIDHVLYAKCDTEGNDPNVLLGAEETLCQGKVDILQFEYNHRWITCKHYLRDVFDYIADKPYLIGKLHGNGIEVYDQWHPELERFFETNYVLIRKNSCFEDLCSHYYFDHTNVPVPG